MANMGAGFLTGFPAALGLGKPYAKDKLLNPQVICNPGAESGWQFLGNHSKRMILFDELNKCNYYLSIDQLLQCARRLETRVLRDYFTDIKILKKYDNIIRIF